MSERWKQRPEGSNWGDFGPDDELGRINLLTPERVRAAVSEVREGRVFCLSLPLDFPGGNVLNPRRHPPRRFATVREGRTGFNFLLRSVDPSHVDVSCDDAVLMALQYSTQWDSFAHIGALFDADGDGVAEPVYYNGFRAGTDVVAPEFRRGIVDWCCSEGVQAKRLGIETMAAAGVQGRGVMIDLFGACGRQRRVLGYDVLRRLMDEQRVEVEAGDLVCLWTGFDELILELDRKPTEAALHGSCAALDGRDERLLQWISDSGMAAIISDNYAVEQLPARAPDAAAGNAADHPALPLHHHCLFKLGVHIGELWYLAELARWLRANGRNRFLLTAPPLRLPGAVGSPVTPVATV
ncbi:MAG TPA: cyclase family protein [Burkholderiaceae bacterium]|nr:cyclase family protein [Burkholderiaceae bacterium]